jgi:hypothetical protein
MTALLREITKGESPVRIDRLESSTVNSEELIATGLVVVLPVIVSDETIEVVLVLLQRTSPEMTLTGPREISHVVVMVCGSGYR